MRSGRCVCFWYCLLEDRKKSKGAETRATNINVDIKPYQTISSNDVMYSTTCVFYVTLQISIPHITSIYICQVGGCSVAALATLAWAGCESHWVGGVGGFVPFDPFYAMPAVTIAFKYEEQALQLYQLSLTGLLSGLDLLYGFGVGHWLIFSKSGLVA